MTDWEWSIVSLHKIRQDKALLSLITQASCCRYDEPTWAHTSALLPFKGEMLQRCEQTSRQKKKNKTKAWSRDRKWTVALLSCYYSSRLNRHLWMFQVLYVGNKRCLTEKKRLLLETRHFEITLFLRAVIMKLQYFCWSVPSRPRNTDQLRTSSNLTFRVFFCFLLHFMATWGDD